MADLINATDSLNTGRVKINAIIEDASAAVIAAESASATAGEAKTTADSVQTQLDTIILDSGTSDAEIVQSRVDKDGKLYATLKERLDSSDSQLAQIAINVKTFGAIGDGIADDTQSFVDAITYIKQHKAKLYIPNGTYNILGEISNGFFENVTIEGQSKENTTILYGNSSTSSGLPPLFILGERAHLSNFTVMVHELFQSKAIVIGYYNGIYAGSKDYKRTSIKNVNINST